MTISYQVNLFFGKYPKMFINLITTTNSYPISLFFFGEYLNIFIILNITSSSYLIHLFFRNCLKIKKSHSDRHFSLSLQTGSECMTFLWRLYRLALGGPRSSIAGPLMDIMHWIPCIYFDVYRVSVWLADGQEGRGV